MRGCRARGAFARRTISPQSRLFPVLNRALKRRDSAVIVTVEEGAVGGFGAHVLHWLALEGLMDGDLKVRPMVLPDEFIETATQFQQYETAGLNAKHIVGTVMRTLSPAKVRQPAL